MLCKLLDNRLTEVYRDCWFLLISSSGAFKRVRACAPTSDGVCANAFNLAGAVKISA